MDCSLDQYSTCYASNLLKNFKCALIMVLLREHERQRWDASRIIKVRNEAKRFYVYHDASNLWRTCSHNTKTKINMYNLYNTDIVILLCH